MPNMQNPILNAFHDKAVRASQLGGALNVDSHGGFTVDGKSWIGKKVLWLKQHFFPSRMRRQNMRVLTTLAKTLQDNLGVPGAGRMMQKEFGALAGKASSTPLLAARLAKAVENYDRTIERRDLKDNADGAYAYADKVFDEFLRPERNIKHNMRRLLHAPQKPPVKESPAEERNTMEQEKSLRAIPSKPEGADQEKRIEIRQPENEARQMEAQQWDYENMSEALYTNFPGSPYKNAEPSRMREKEDEHIYEPIPGARPLQERSALEEEAPHDYANAGFSFSRPAEPRGVSSRAETLLAPLGVSGAAMRGKILNLKENYNLFISKLARQQPERADLYQNAQGNFRRGFMEAAFLVMLKEEGIIKSLPSSAREMGLQNPQDLQWLQNQYHALAPNPHRLSV